MKLTNSLQETILNIDSDNFDEFALQVFYSQAHANPVYKSYLKSLKINPNQIKSSLDIPFLPISFFKSHKVLVDGVEVETKFMSSGTTGLVRSTHYISDPEWYLSVCENIFEKFYFPIEDCIILALLPSYQENPHSSLIFMINHFIRKSMNQFSGFVQKAKQIEEILQKPETSKKKVILFGVSYALLDLADTGISLDGVTMIETGGMKGRRKELTKEELHRVLSQKFNIPTIHSEYGMTELLSQAYSDSEGLFSTPPWMKVMTRELNDPFLDNTGQRSGLIKVIDLANIESCCFIETEDLGICTDNGQFKVLGRMDNAEVRGCNLMYQG
jgi:phenylacetate-coenzyme A ligase PaaK-like adenylate-forming protein